MIRSVFKAKHPTPPLTSSPALETHIAQWSMIWFDAIVFFYKIVLLLGHTHTSQGCNPPQSGEIKKNHESSYAKNPNIGHSASWKHAFPPTMCHYLLFDHHFYNRRTSHFFSRLWRMISVPNRAAYLLVVLAFNNLWLKIILRAKSYYTSVDLNKF